MCCLMISQPFGVFRRANLQVIGGFPDKTTYTTGSELVNRWKTLLQDLPDLKKPKLLSAEDFPDHLEEWNQIQQKNKASIQWLPLLTHGKETIGLWFEKWEDPAGSAFSKDRMKIVQEYLVPGYAAAWNRICSRMTFQKFQSFFTKETAQLSRGHPLGLHVAGAISRCASLLPVKSWPKTLTSSRPRKMAL